MRILLLVFCHLLLQFSFAKSVGDNQNHQILSYDSEQTDDGYHFQYETSNEIVRKETGTIIKGNTDENSSLQVQGEFSYISPEGQFHFTKYTSGKEGYKAKTSIQVGSPPISIKPLSELPLISSTYPPVPQEPFRPPVEVVLAPAALASLAGGGLG